MYVCERDCYVNKRLYRKGQTLDTKPCRHFTPMDTAEHSSETADSLAGLSYKELLKRAKDLAKARGIKLKSRKRDDLERFCGEGA